MFAYCLNNPINHIDNTGDSATIAGAIIGGIFGFIGGVMGGGTAEEILQCTLTGAITGAAAGFVADVSVATFGVGTAIMVTATANAVSSMVNSYVTQSVLNDGDVDEGKVIYDGIVGAATGALGTAATHTGTTVAGTIDDGIRYVDALVGSEITVASSNLFLGVKPQALDSAYTSITSFGSWFGGVLYDGYKRMLK